MLFGSIYARVQMPPPEPLSLWAKLFVIGLLMTLLVFIAVNAAPDLDDWF